METVVGKFFGRIGILFWGLNVYFTAETIEQALNCIHTFCYAVGSNSE